MKFKEARMIRSDEVKAMCIKDGFYTCGTNAEYCHFIAWQKDIREEWQSISTGTVRSDVCVRQS